MRFLRHDGSDRSDVSLVLVNPAQMSPPVGRPRCQAIARDGRSTPCPSSAMSSGRLFLDRGGRHQSPSPLRRHPQNKSLAFRRANKYHRTAGSVLTVCVSRGDKRSAMTRPGPAEWLGNRSAFGQFHLNQKEKAADQGVDPPASSCGRPLKRTGDFGRVGWYLGRTRVAQASDLGCGHVAVSPPNMRNHVTGFILRDGIARTRPPGGWSATRRKVEPAKRPPSGRRERYRTISVAVD